MASAFMLLGCIEHIETSVWARPRAPEGAIDAGVAVLHHRALCSMAIHDRSGRLHDEVLTGKWGSDGVVARDMHRDVPLLQHVKWSKRPAGNEVVTVFAMPPGSYELVGYGVDGAGWAIDTEHRSPFALGHTLCVDGWHKYHAVTVPFDVKPGEVTLLGELTCADASCAPLVVALDRAAQQKVRAVLELDVAAPVADEETTARWQSWLPAIRRASAATPE